MRLAVGVVDGFKLFFNPPLLSKGLNDPHAVDVLRQITYQSCYPPPREPEGALSVTGKNVSGQGHQGQDDKGEQRQLGAHGYHDDDNAQQDQHIPQQRNDPLCQQIVDDGHIIDDPGNSNADDGAVMVS